MKFFFSISLSAVLLLQSFNLGFPDILKVGELLEHAQFHAEIHGDDFFVFLSKHYGDLKEQHNREHQEEEKEHEKLPFNHQGQVHSVTGIVLPATATISFKIAAVTDTASVFFYKETYSSIEESAIFQPPRYA